MSGDEHPSATTMGKVSPEPLPAGMLKPDLVGRPADPPGPEAPAPAADNVVRGRCSFTAKDLTLKGTQEFTTQDPVDRYDFRSGVTFHAAMAMNLIPALLLAAVTTIGPALWANTAFSAVLEELAHQPAGLVAPGFDYTVQPNKPPPGPGPHGGSHVYGHRSDHGAKWANVPSISGNLVVSQYHGTGIEGHPNVGHFYGMWLMTAMSMTSAFFTYGILPLQLYILYADQLGGRRKWVVFGVYAMEVAVYCGIKASENIGNMASGTPQTALQVNSGLMWFTTSIIIMVLSARFCLKLQYVVRSTLVPLLIVGALATIFPMFIIPLIETTHHIVGADEDLVLLRCILWPAVTELLFFMPARAGLRSIPREAMKKSGAAMGMLCAVFARLFIGRMLLFRLRSVEWMLASSAILAVEEIFFRLTVAKRDKLFYRIFTGKSKAETDEYFAEPENVKLRCDGMINEMMAEQAVILLGFIQALVQRSTASPDEMVSFPMLVFNMVQQFVGEIGVDSWCLHKEINKQKLRIATAWRSRAANFPWVIALIFGSAAFYISICFPTIYCPLRHPENGLIWLTCTVNKA